VSLGHPRKFQRVSRLGFVTAPTTLNGGQPNFARRSAVFWASTLCIHFRRLLPPNGILPVATFTLSASLASSYIGSVTVALEQWASARLCGVQQRAPPIFGRAAITFGIGPHSSLLFREYDACYNIR